MPKQSSALALAVLTPLNLGLDDKAGAYYQTNQT